MNIQDILTGMKKSTGDCLTTKVQIRAESHKIDRRADDFSDQIITWLADELKYINNGLTYSYNPTDVKLSEEDKKILINKLESVAKEIPSKITSMLNDIFDCKKDDDEEEVEVEIAVEPKKVAEMPPVPVASSFGY